MVGLNVSNEEAFLDAIVSTKFTLEHRHDVDQVLEFES